MEELRLKNVEMMQGDRRPIPSNNLHSATGTAISRLCRHGRIPR